MRKDIKDSIKRIMAIVLASSMTLSMNVSAFAEDVILTEAVEEELIDQCKEEIETPEEIETKQCEEEIQDAMSEEVPAASEGEASYKVVEEVINGVTHHVTYTDYEDGSHRVTACPECTVNGEDPINTHIRNDPFGAPHYFVNGSCIKCGFTPAEGEMDEEIKNADLKSANDSRLREYLALKYSTYNTDTSKTNVRGNQYLSLDELNNIPENIEIEIGNDTDAKLKELTKYMVNFDCLTHLTNVKTIKIYGADIRFLYLPKQIENLVIQDSTFNLYRERGIFSETENDAEYEGTKSCTNLKSATLNNVTIGNHYKDTTGKYINTYYYHILNSTKLESFYINVKFTEPEQRFVIDAGNTAYSNMAACTISNGTEGEGIIIIKSSNNESYFAKHFSQYIIEEADLESYFRRYLLNCTEIDTNKDRILTQAELDAVENLTITYSDGLFSYLDPIHDLSEIAKFTNLKTLTIEKTVIRDNYYINNVAFPQNDKLTSITFHNNGTEFPEGYILEIPSSVVNFEYTNNAAKDERSSNDFANIKINDSGKLKSVRLDYSNVKNIEINNTTGNKRVLELLSAMECSKLEQITLDGSGYTLSGSVTLNDSNNLTKIGKANTGDSTKWTVNLTSDTLLNISNCTNFGTATSNIEINTNRKAAGIIAYGVNGLSSNESDPHTLSINEGATGQTNITLRYDDDSAWWKTYAESIGATSEQGSSIPNVAVFGIGNHLRNSAKADGWTPYERWVDQYDIELSITDDVHFFTNSVAYYVEEEIAGQKTLRKVTDSSNVTFESSDTNLYILEDTTYEGKPDGKLSPYVYGKKPGRATITAYWNYKDESGNVTEKIPIGEANILSASPAYGIDFSINASLQADAGTKENPIYVEKEAGRLSISAKNRYVNEDYLYTDRDSIRWMIYDAYNEKEYSYRGDATNAGVSVVSDSFNEDSPVRTNTKEFKFSKNGNDFFRITAQVPLSKYYNGESSWGDCINQSCYVKVVDPCDISVSNRNIIYGEADKEYSTITVTNSKACDISIKDAEKYKNYFKVERTKLDENDTSVWKLSLNCDAADEKEVEELFKLVGEITLNIDVNNVRREEPIALHAHTFETEYSKDESGHWYAASCGHDVKKDFAAHVSGGAATEEAAEVCTVCGYEIAPKLNHTHTFETEYSKDESGHWYAASCGHDAKKDFAAHTSSGPATEEKAEVCTVCGYEIAPKLDHTHTFETEYTKDESGHWYAASCGHDVKKDFAAHVSGGAATEEAAEVCTVCGYEIAPKLEPKLEPKPHIQPGEGLWCMDIPDMVYTGEKIKPEIDVYYDGVLLTKDIDYSLSYGSYNTDVASKAAINPKNNKSIAPSVTITAKGAYTGKKTVYFSIIPRSVEDAYIDVTSITAAKSDKGSMVKPVVIFDENKLKAGSDYVVSKSTDIADAVTQINEEGEHALYVLGQGNYCGVIPFSFNVTTDILADKVTIDKIANQKYNGSSIEPSVRITYQKKTNDVTALFDISYENNKEIGTAAVIITAKKDSGFAGSKRASFKITGSKITAAKLGTDGREKIPAQIYDGNEHTPDLNLYAGTTALVKDIDYTVTYSKNVNAGTATATVTGKGSYSGTKKFKFKINKYDAARDEKAIIKINDAAPIYEPYVKGGVKVKPVITMNGKKLIEKRDYTLSYANNSNVANSEDEKAPTLLIKFKGNLSGRKSVKFTIVNGDGSNNV